jgi:hypothetical protein
MIEQTTKNAKVLFGSSQGTLHITEKSIMFEDEKGEITGIEKSAIRMVKTSDDREVVVAYASGAEVKSVRIKPLEDNAAGLLILLGDKEHVPPTVFDEEFEKIYLHWKNKLEAELRQSIEGRPYHLEHEEKSQVALASSSMQAILQWRYNMPGRMRDKSIWNLPDTPEEYQLGWAKVEYVDSFLPHMIEVASGYHYLYRNHQPIYQDFDGMWPEDWERFFLHYRIIEKPILTEDLKKKARERAEVEVA